MIMNLNDYLEIAETFYLFAVGYHCSEAYYMSGSLLDVSQRWSSTLRPTP